MGSEQRLFDDIHLERTSTKIDFSLIYVNDQQLQSTSMSIVTRFTYADGFSLPL